ncbi:MAG: hypothetical protein ACRDQH_05055 [Pseudonocardiaceae bacterium]
MVTKRPRRRLARPEIVFAVGEQDLPNPPAQNCTDDDEHRENT